MKNIIKKMTKARSENYEISSDIPKEIEQALTKRADAAKDLTEANRVIKKYLETNDIHIDPELCQEADTAVYAMPYNAAQMIREAIRRASSSTDLANRQEADLQSEGDEEIERIIADSKDAALRLQK